MKNIALVLPLTIALLLSACNNANDQTDNSRNDQGSENIETINFDYDFIANRESIIKNKTDLEIINYKNKKILEIVNERT